MIELSLANGSTVLLENIGETVDPVLDPLLGRNLIKKGRAIKIGDKEVEYNSMFRLLLHTKLANPHYKPEMQAQTTLINFTVTRDGLEDQLLAEVVKAERPDLEELKAELTRQQNDFKITLNSLEDSLLSRYKFSLPNFVSKITDNNIKSSDCASARLSAKINRAKLTQVERRKVVTRITLHYARHDAIRYYQFQERFSSRIKFPLIRSSYYRDDT